MNTNGPESLLTLANTLQQQVAVLQEHLNSSDQQSPSFDGKVKPTNWKAVDDVRRAALENAIQLQDLLYTPREMLQSRQATDYISRHAIDRWNIAQAVPLDSTTTYAALAEKLNKPEKTLRRILRHAMTQRIFHEPSPGMVAHTQASRLLAEDSKLRDYFGTVCEEVWPACTRAVDAIDKWPDSREKEESGYFLAKGKTIYQTLAADERKQARYDNAMNAFKNERSHSFEHAINGFDWAALGKGAMVVDIGGGLGGASKALARAFPGLNFVVQDRADVLVNAVVDVDLEGRLEFQVHDFFHPQPVKDADVYFFRRVMMEWPDSSIIEILSGLKPALKLGAVVQVQDFFVPEPGQGTPLWQERKFRSTDLLALALANAGSRDGEEWRILFEKAGKGFEWKGVRIIEGSDVAFIEAVWRDE